nr:YqgE/AlgH family protein [Candidatus Megaera venefica]
MMDQNFSDLTGKILIASPFAMEGNVFHKSLIYVVKHANEGSIGLIFNRPVRSALANNLFNKVDANFNFDNLELNIHIGGPVEVERGFFLHSSEYDKNLLFNPNQGELAVSSNVQILQDIATGIGPKNSLFIVGYTGWGSGQLDFELEHNLWIIADPDKELIFSENDSDKWTKALNIVGVSSNDFIPFVATC